MVSAAALGLADAELGALDIAVRGEREKRQASALRLEREEAQREIEREKQDIRQEMWAELERERAVLELERESMRRDGEIFPHSAFHIPRRPKFRLSSSPRIIFVRLLYLMLSSNWCLHRNNYGVRGKNLCSVRSAWSGPRTSTSIAVSTLHCKNRFLHIYDCGLISFLTCVFMVRIFSNFLYCLANLARKVQRQT
jgi:hypothetical protein